MSIKTISLSYEKVFVFSVSVEKVDSGLGLRLNGVLVPVLEEKYKNIFSYIGIGLRICDLNIVFADENNCSDCFKEEYELPILLSIFLFFELFNFNLDDYLCIGRISENGDLLPTKGVFASSLYVLNYNLHGIICPKGNCHESGLFSSDINVVVCGNILELLNFFNHKVSSNCGNKRIDFFMSPGSDLILKNNCILVGDLNKIYKIIQGLSVALIKDQLFEMLLCVSFKEILSKSYSISRPVFDFQYCFLDFIDSLFDCKIGNFDKFNNNLILNRSVVGKINFDLFNALFFNDFPIIYLHQFESFPGNKIDIVLRFFTQRFYNFKIILSTENNSEKVLSLKKNGFEVIKII